MAKKAMAAAGSNVVVQASDEHQKQTARGLQGRCRLFHSVSIHRRLSPVLLELLPTPSPLPGQGPGGKPFAEV